MTFHPLQQVSFVKRFTEDKIHQSSGDCIHNKDLIVQIYQVLDIPWDHFN